MSRFFRGIFIVWTVWRFGLHELILSNFNQPLLKLLSKILTLGRTYKASRGERLRLSLEHLGPIFEIWTSDVHTARLVARRHRHRVGQTPRPRATL